jgi:hypothetical protein
VEERADRSGDQRQRLQEEQLHCGVQCVVDINEGKKYYHSVESNMGRLAGYGDNVPVLFQNKRKNVRVMFSVVSTEGSQTERGSSQTRFHDQHTDIFVIGDINCGPHISRILFEAKIRFK